VLILMIAGAILLLWACFAPREHEPSYEGRTLSQWLIAYNHDRVQHTPQSRSLADATNAVHHIGTNALPLLVKWISYEIPRWRTGFIDKFTQNPGTVRAYAALTGFEILGPEGAPAAPALNNLLSDWDRKPPSRATVDRAIFALSYMGDPGLAPLVSLVTNRSAPRVYRKQAVGSIWKSVTRLDANTSWAVPALIGCLDDPEVAPMVAKVLGDLRLEHALAVPALTRSLQNNDTRTAIEAAKSLGKFGTNATVAVPELLKALGRNDNGLRMAATNALETIAPEVLKKVGH
jgi:HEAT repeats